MAYLSAGNRFVTSDLGFQFVGPVDIDSRQLLVGDIDGDGLPDLVFREGADWKNCRMALTGSTVPATPAPGGGAPLSIAVETVTATCASFSGPTGSASWRRPVSADFNGDGLMDFAIYVDNGQWDLRVSTGDGNFKYVPMTAGAAPRPGNEYPVAADANGDGLTDLINYYDNGQWTVCLAPADEQKTTWNCQLWSGNGGGVAGNFWGDFDGDGRIDMAMPRPSNPFGYEVRMSGRNAPDVIERIVNGMKAETKINYRPLTDSSVYTRDEIITPTGYQTGSAVQTFPRRQLQTPMFVVASVESPNGIGGYNRSDHRYAGMKADLEGRGSLGFRETVSTDLASGISVQTAYRQDWPFIGNVASTTTSVASQFGNRKMKVESSVYATLGTASPTTPIFTYAKANTVKSYELTTEQLLSVVTSTSTYGSYTSGAAACSYTGNNCGNATQVVVKTSGSDNDIGPFWTKTNDNVYTDTVVSPPGNPGLNNWRLGRLTSSTVTSSDIDPVTPDIVRRASFTYYADGLLNQEIVEPNTLSLRLVTQNFYDAWGNKTEVRQSSHTSAPAINRITTRTVSKVTYDSNRRCLSTQANALNHTETYAYTHSDPSAARANRSWCQPSTLTGPNGLVTEFTYDWMNRKIKEVRNKGVAGMETSTQTQLYRCGTGVEGGVCEGRAVHYAVTVSTGTPRARVYQDILGREVRSEGTGFGGRTVRKDIAYDVRGKAVKASLPYFVNDAILWVESAYDEAGRVKTVSRPEAAGSTATDTVTYSGFSTEYTNAKGQKRTELRNPVGQLVSVTDNAGKAVTYGYNAVGDVLVTRDPAGNEIKVEYDTRGRKTKQIDPDMGTWTYVVDVLGNLRQQTDAKSQVKTMVYDLLNRPTSRTEPTFNSTWTYDTCLASNTGGKCIGRLVTVSNTTGFKREHSYDGIGRPSAVASTIDAAAYVASTSYDPAGRVQTVTYPNGYGYTNTYSSHGYLQEVRQNGAAGTLPDQALLWSLVDADAQGRPTRERNHAGVDTRTGYDSVNQRLKHILVGRNGGTEVQHHTLQFDTIGRLSQMVDANLNLTESIGDAGYDAVNRLLSVTRTGAQSGVDTVSYDSAGLGNIASKSGVGSYGYNLSGANSVRPHAVARITGTVLGFVNPTFGYDANGNLTSGLGRTVTYTSFNLPQRIEQRNSAGSLLHTADFTYDPDYQRIKQVAGATTTIYLNPRIDLGGTYTKETTGSTVTHRWVVYAGGKAVMEMQRVDGSPATWKPRWYHTNHLGSLVALTDASGTVVERLSYDAWGKRRNLNGTADGAFPGSGLKSAETTRGYTLHEHLEALGLVHMNGRIYDPLLGRFMQADSIIQAPDNLQSLNRYSYVINNPLMYTDPSGNVFGGVVIHAALKEIFKHVGYNEGQILVAIGCAAVSGGNPAVAAGCSAYGTYMNARAHGQSKGDAQGAAAWAGVTTFIRTGIGDATTYQSESFDYATGFTVTESVVDLPLNVALHAGWGCFSASAQGGSCANGAAVSGAVAFIDNAGLHTQMPGGAARNVVGFVQAVVVGGTVAQVSGGKFGNGAASAAFIYLYNHLMHVTGGIRERRNPFGHTALAVEGNGMFSYGNDTPLGSDPLDYIAKQSQFRDQVVTIIPTTPEQDAAALRYFLGKPGMNSVGNIDNCVVRTQGALWSAGIRTRAYPFPGSLAHETQSLPGAQTYFIPKGGEIPKALVDVIRLRFTPPSLP